MDKKTRMEKEIEELFRQADKSFEKDTKSTSSSILVRYNKDGKGSVMVTGYGEDLIGLAHQVINALSQGMDIPFGVLVLKLMEIEMMGEDEDE